MTNKIDITWDVDDGSFDAAFKESGQRIGGDNEFLQMLSEEKGQQITEFRVGDKVVGTISAISEFSDDVTVEVGSKTSAVMSKQELMEPDPTNSYKAGDQIEAFILSKAGGEIVLGRSMSHKVAKDQALDAAYAGELPVKGKVVKVNKGGFEVQVLGKLAFCPVSQMDTKFIKEDEKERYLGGEFDFIIEQMNGKNIVVSRSALLRQTQSEQLDIIKSQLAENSVFDGVVTELRDFGAMVEFKGIVGMVHISEVSHSRVANVSEVLQVGQKVKVKVLTIDEQKGMPRVGLSIKQAGEDPWDAAAEKLSVGQNYSGRVVRLETFGAFVEIFPGLEGLIHVSEMSWVKRINHPKDVLKQGDIVNVRVLSVDLTSHRISLSLKSLDDDPWQKVERELKPGTICKGKVSSLKGFGALIELEQGVLAMLPTGVLKAAFGEAYRKHATPLKELEVVISQIDQAERKILLSLPNLAADDAGATDFKEYVESERVRKAVAAPTEKSLGSFGELLTRSLTAKKPSAN
jgi:small subunit ribosomal protein S1